MVLLKFREALTEKSDLLHHLKPYEHEISVKLHDVQLLTSMDVINNGYTFDQENIGILNIRNTEKTKQFLKTKR